MLSAACLMCIHSAPAIITLKGNGPRATLLMLRSRNCVSTFAEGNYGPVVSYVLIIVEREFKLILIPDLYACHQALRCQCVLEVVSKLPSPPPLLPRWGVYRPAAKFKLLDRLVSLVEIVPLLVVFVYLRLVTLNPQARLVRRARPALLLAFRLVPILAAHR